MNSGASGDSVQNKPPAESPQRKRTKSFDVRPDHTRMDVEKVNFRKLFRDMRMHVDVGLKLYRAKRTEDDSIFYDIFKKLEFLLRQAQENQEYMSAHVSEYDFVDPDGVHVKGSGYRTVLFFLSCVLQLLHQCLQKTAKDRSSFRFSASEHINSLYIQCSAMQGAERFVYFSRLLMEATPPPHLFNVGEVCQKVIRVSHMEYLSRDVFYGPLFGIQFSSNLKPVLKMLGVGMASYEQWYRGDKDEPVKQILTSLWKGSRYLKSATRLGLKLDSLTMDCSVHFVKAFWSLSEISTFQSAVKLIHQSVEISHWMEVPSKEIKIQSIDGDEVVIHPPSVHIGFKPIPLLLLSYRWRGSQPYSRATKKQPAPLSPGLIVHMHGGGYVAQTPHSHEFYLRRWALDLNVPIVSIDYSLSPEAPFPRALEECVMAYCWILQNLELLGTTGERIMFVGDSSGGNFAITTSMKLNSLKIRLPDSILAVYPSTNVTSSACPSRVISIIDPILPLGVLVACQQAYSNQMPTPEDLALRKEYRRRIMRAQGYYLPDADTSSPSWNAKRKKTKKSASVSTEEEMVSKKSKVLPPRPPPPSVSSPKLEAASPDQETSDPPSLQFDEMMEVPLIGADTNGEERDTELYQNKIPVCFKQKPSEQDKLSPTEFEELMEELMKSHVDSDATADPFMSPMLAPNELLSGLPPVHIVGAALDSILDDAVGMAQKLKSANQPVTLNVVDNLPHAFLTLVTTGNNTDMNLATKLCLDYMRQGLNIDIEDSLRGKK